MFPQNMKVIGQCVAVVSFSINTDLLSVCCLPNVVLSYIRKPCTIALKVEV